MQDGHEKTYSRPSKKTTQPRPVYATKLSFLTEGEMKTFHNKQKLKKFITPIPALQKILKGLLHTEDTRKNNPFDQAD
jgi:hypothetical protein